MKSIPRLIATLAMLILAATNRADAQGTTAITYQGRLNTSGNPANGLYDLSFAVYDANVEGNLIAGPITNTAVAVSNGLFTVTLDFGSGVFTGTNYWVEMAVSPLGTGTFSTLAPRQPLTPAPYAISLVSPQATALNPAGAIIAFGGTNVPNGYLLCDGSAVSRTTYAALFAAIGTAWGAGDGSTTFHLPDMRGVFLRGVDNGRGQDPDTASRTASKAGGNTGGAVGSFQSDAFASHNHQPPGAPGTGFLTWWNPGGCANGADAALAAIQAGGITCGLSWATAAAGGSESRPKNVYVNYIIKY